MSTGKRIKTRRKQIGMSAETLASIIGVAPTTIYRYENGGIERVDSTKLEPIAVALGTTPAYLMGWEEEESTVGDVEREGSHSPSSSRSPEWRVLSEGLGDLEKKNKAAFQATYNYLTAMYPDIFTERIDDDDTES